MHTHKNTFQIRVVSHFLVDEIDVSSLFLKIKMVLSVTGSVTRVPTGGNTTSSSTNTPLENNYVWPPCCKCEGRGTQPTTRAHWSNLVFQYRKKKQSRLRNSWRTCRPKQGKAQDALHRTEHRQSRLAGLARYQRMLSTPRPHSVSHMQ